MKWSKRPANWRNSPLVSDVRDRWKHQGNSLLNIIMEIYTERFEVLPGWFLHMSLTALKREARFHRMPDMVKILRWIGEWPHHEGGFQGMVQGMVQGTVQGRVQTDIAQESVRSLSELCLKSARSLPEVCLNDDRIMVELTKTHVSIFIPKFLELLDKYTLQKLRDQMANWPVTGQSVASRSDLNRIKDDDLPAASRDGPPDTAQIVDLCQMIVELSGRNGKKMNGASLMSRAVKQGIHPAAIIDTLQEVVRRWHKIEKPPGYWVKTLEERSGAHGAYDWAAYPAEKMLLISVGEAAKTKGS